MRDALELNRGELKSLEAWRTTFAEFIATLLFVFLGAGSVIITGTLTGGELTATRLVTIALAHGLAISLLVFATAHISGGHLNPAVTFAAMLTNRISAARGLMFIVAQVVGAVVGVLLLLATIPDAANTNLGAHSLGPGVSIGMALLMEIVLTFVLVFVVFATAVDPGGMGNLAPIAIGLAVLVDHLVAVPITGASMNPARSFGPALVAGEWANHWVYWVAPLLGGAIAGFVYQFAFINRPR
ncbi:MAG: MIP family channel protein [Chloroflexi bacterium]|nr:MIP family channel protein [Chloroflexota bacterium]